MFPSLFPEVRGNTKYALTTTDNLIDEVHNQWTKMVDNFFSNDSVASMKSKIKSNLNGYPKADVYRTDTDYRIVLSVPGVKSGDIEVNVTEPKHDPFYVEDRRKYVKVSGKMSDDYSVSDESNQWKVRELKRGSFERVFSLPDDTEGEPDAVLKDGLLSLTWKIKPKQAVDVPKLKAITIKTE